MNKALHIILISFVMLFSVAMKSNAQGVQHNFGDSNGDRVKLGQNYPNPAVGKTYIEIDFEGEEATLSVYNVVGKLIEERVVSTKLVVLDVSQYNEGFYLYTLEANGEKVTRRMTVRKQ